MERKERASAVSGLDIHSCLHFLLEQFGQFLLPNATPKVPLMQLNETVKSVSDFYYWLVRVSSSINLWRASKFKNTGFPPIREFRENFEDFFQSGKSGKNRGFSAKIRELFFQTIFKPFKPINLRKMFFKTVKPQELSGNCNIYLD